MFVALVGPKKRHEGDGNCTVHEAREHTLQKRVRGNGRNGASTHKGEADESQHGRCEHYDDAFESCMHEVHANTGVPVQPREQRLSLNQAAKNNVGARLGRSPLKNAHSHKHATRTSGKQGWRRRGRGIEGGRSAKPKGKYCYYVSLMSPSMQVDENICRVGMDASPLRGLHDFHMILAPLPPLTQRP